METAATTTPVVSRGSVSVVVVAGAATGSAVRDFGTNGGNGVDLVSVLIKKVRVRVLSITSLRNLHTNDEVAQRMLCKKHCLVVMPTTAPNVANEEMPLAQPTYEYIRAPILTEWSQPALVEYRRQRRLYEEKICERCTTTGDAAYAVAVSIKASTDPRVLDQLAFYILKKPVLEVSVEDHIRTSQTKAGNMMNDYVPDVERLFYRLKMNMHQTDIEARVAQYFIHFDKIVEKHGLIGVLGRQGTSDPALAKMRYIFLVRRLQPEVLCREVERMAQVIHSHVKTDCISLYELVVDRVKRQHQAHMLHSKMRSTRRSSGSSDQSLPRKGNTSDANSSSASGETRGDGRRQQQEEAA